LGGGGGGGPALGGKLAVVEQLLAAANEQTFGNREKFVLVSNFTATLDLLGQLCGRKRWQYLRLDGKTSAANRQKMVDQFNSPYSKNIFIFLLSAKAGGVGINLVGASRLVMFDPDWNPATDQQAMARVWRDGQTRPVTIYRLLTTGTIEEKIFQRQLAKGALAAVLEDSGERDAAEEEEEEAEEEEAAAAGAAAAGAAAAERRGGAARQFSQTELRELFTLQADTLCDTADLLRRRGALQGRGAAGGWANACDAPAELGCALLRTIFARSPDVAGRAISFLHVEAEEGGAPAAAAPAPASPVRAAAPEECESPSLSPSLSPSPSKAAPPPLELAPVAAAPPLSEEERKKRTFLLGDIKHFIRAAKQVRAPHHTMRLEIIGPRFGSFNEKCQSFMGGRSEKLQTRHTRGLYAWYGVARSYGNRTSLEQAGRAMTSGRAIARICPGPPCRRGEAPAAFAAVNLLSMAVLHVRAGRLTAQRGGFRPDQSTR
jgi:hypothetical protein